jgi:hypothetical protein
MCQLHSPVDVPYSVHVIGVQSVFVPLAVQLTWHTHMPGNLCSESVLPDAALLWTILSGALLYYSIVCRPGNRSLTIIPAATAAHGCRNGCHQGACLCCVTVLDAAYPV